jgi:hypothetical protein
MSRKWKPFDVKLLRMPLTRTKQHKEQKYKGNRKIKLN